MVGGGGGDWSHNHKADKYQVTKNKNGDTNHLGKEITYDNESVLNHR